MEDIISNPQSDGKSVTDTVEVVQERKSVETAVLERPLYGLFIIPLVLIFTGVLCGYLRNVIFEKVRNLIRNVDNFMLSIDEDLGQTLVNVLDILNSQGTYDGNSSSDLIWDDSIERNDEEIVKNIN